MAPFWRLRSDSRAAPANPRAGHCSRLKSPPTATATPKTTTQLVSIAAQDAVLQRVRRALAPGGVLLLRVGDAAGGLGFHISSWVDRVVTMLRVHRLVTLHCRHLSAWQSALEGLGFMVEARAMSQGTLFANVLLIARLPAGTGEGLSRPGSLPEPGFAARLVARTGLADVGGAPPAACCGASLPLQRAVIGAGGAALLHASA